MSSADKPLGCFLTRDAAEARLQETGQERLLQVIGTDRSARGARGPPGARCPASELRRGGADVATTRGAGDGGVLLRGAPRPGGRLPRRRWRARSTSSGPVRGHGRCDHARRTAVYTRGVSGGCRAGWQINFDLTGEGAGVFGDVTTRLAGRQLAIVVDREVISAPTVRGADHERHRRDQRELHQEARAGPRHPAERRRPAGRAQDAAGPDREPDAGEGVARPGGGRRGRGAGAARPVPALLLPDPRGRGVARDDDLGDPGVRR